MHDLGHKIKKGYCGYIFQYESLCKVIGGVYSIDVLLEEVYYVVYILINNFSNVFGCIQFNRGYFVV